jgi:60 kDa SS-A/Ro ribonucleoprotein
LTAMIRNLGNMAKAGLLTSKSNATKKVLAELGNQDRLRKSRIHPMNVLIAYLMYAQGRSLKVTGSGQPSLRSFRGSTKRSI